jgi:hypothetical protein
MTFEELIEKLAEWPDGCDEEQFREYQRSILTPYLADREERIRVLDEEFRVNWQALINEQARIERVKGLALELEMCCPCGARPESLNTHPHVIGCSVALILAALDGETK